MKLQLTAALCLAVAVPIVAQDLGPAGFAKNPRPGGDAFEGLMDAQPKLLKITATVDGSDKVIFTRDSVRVEHRQWSPMTRVTFGGEPWTDLTRTPPTWRESSANFDLTRAYVVKRSGRDVVAMEPTADGFDVYFCDSPNDSAEYEVTIAIPRRR